MREYDPFEYDDVRTLCEVIDNCDDCPRKGDDCDGRYDDEDDVFEDDEEIEYDGFITREEDLKPLERTSEHTAIPTRECIYPRCEECDKYHGHYCTVPMVISKQIYRTVQERMRKMEESIAWLEKTVTDEILGEKEPPMSMANAGVRCEDCIYYNRIDKYGGNCKYHGQYTSPRMCCKRGVFKP